MKTHRTVTLDEAAASVYNLHLLGVLAGEKKEENPFVLTLDERPVVDEVLRLAALRVAGELHDNVNVEIPEDSSSDVLMRLEFDSEYPDRFCSLVKAAVTACALSLLGASGTRGADYPRMAAEHIRLAQSLLATGYPSLSFNIC